MNAYAEIHDLQEQNEKAALCIIVATKGSTPRKVGAKMLVFESGRIKGTIGGGNLEKKVIENALKQIQKNRPETFNHDLLHQHNMCCGGSVQVYIEPINKMKRLYIFGAGHTGQALSNMAILLDFEVFLIDERKDQLDMTHTKGIQKLHLDHKTVLPSLPFDENSFVVIATFDHAIDREILGYCLKKPHAYLGMIGSMRKVELTKKMFAEAGIATKEELDKVDMPMGIHIGAESPEEIAVSILAKLIQVKNKLNE
ncbi:MAG: XdhC family protein [Flavobacteriales bacterium]|nr:XdhC family protein [Flavobacteriales bacterium]